MEFIRKDNIIELSNPGVTSRQLINSENSKSERVTITEVHLEVDASQPRHKHDTSEQIWYIFDALVQVPVQSLNLCHEAPCCLLLRHLFLSFCCVTVTAIVG